MTDAMIDLETLGTKPDAPIISVGVQLFDTGVKKLGPTFYMVLDVSEQIARGRKVDGETLKWWLGQSDAAKKVFRDEAKHTTVVLQTLSTWLKAQGKIFVWGNGSTFDISMLENIFSQYNLACPWAYNKIMDLRTFKRFRGNDKYVVKSGVDHNALDDATSQAQYVLDNL